MLYHNLICQADWLPLDLDTKATQGSCLFLSKNMVGIAQKVLEEGHRAQHKVTLLLDATYYSVPQSSTPVLVCTTKYYSSTTLYYKVLLQYYSVVQSTTPVRKVSKSTRKSFRSQRESFRIQVARIQR